MYRHNTKLGVGEQQGIMEIIRRALCHQCQIVKIRLLAWLYRDIAESSYRENIDFSMKMSAHRPIIKSDVGFYSNVTRLFFIESDATFLLVTRPFNCDVSFVFSKWPIPFLDAYYLSNVTCLVPCAVLLCFLHSSPINSTPSPLIFSPPDIPSTLNPIPPLSAC